MLFLLPPLHPFFIYRVILLYAPSYCASSAMFRRFRCHKALCYFKLVYLRELHVILRRAQPLNVIHRGRMASVIEACTLGSASAYVGVPPTPFCHFTSWGIIWIYCAGGLMCPAGLLVEILLYDVR